MGKINVRRIRRILKTLLFVQAMHQPACVSSISIVLLSMKLSLSEADLHDIVLNVIEMDIEAPKHDLKFQ